MTTAFATAAGFAASRPASGVIARIIAAVAAAIARAEARHDYRRLLGRDDIVGDMGVRRDDIRQALIANGGRP